MNKNYLLPGEPLRKGVDLIADKKSGALIVVGNTNKLEKISSGGINLKNCAYSPEMLSELAKMDGAIIIDENLSTIIHRTAERVSVETCLQVIAVSEESSAIKVFHNMKVNELEEPAMILGRVNESLQSVDRMRRRFDEVLLQLGELEIEDTITNQQVLTVIQRGELLTRLANQVKNEAENLGEEAGIVMIQIESLESGVEHILSLVLKDHLPAKKYRNIKKVKSEISNLTYEELNTISHLGSVLLMQPLDEISTPRGFRVLARLPGLPDNLHDSLIQKFKTLPRLLGAPTDKLFQVDGIGRNRAQQLRDYFDTLLKNIGFSYINGH
jgi:diadenylate cyclase